MCRIPSAPLHVLVVDACPDMGWSAATLLGLHGHLPQVATTGEEAVELAAADPPHIVLAELQLPGIDGCELVRLLARGDGPPPVFVAVTSSGTAVDRGRTAAAGFHAHLLKPVEPAVLLGLLRRVARALARPGAPPPEAG